MALSETNSITQLTLKTKQIQLNAEGVELFFNFADILKDKDNVYINATGLMKSIEGEERQIQEYFRSTHTQKYISALELFLIKGNSLNKNKGLFYRKAGRYGGTWIHKKLFLNFARWLSPEFEIICDHLLEQVFEYADELRQSRKILRELQIPLNDVIKKYLVDTGIREESAYIQFAVMIKKMVGAPDERDTYTKHQLDTAQKIIEEYRAMIVHGKKTSLKEMNTYLRGTELNLAWIPKQQLLKG